MPKKDTDSKTTNPRKKGAKFREPVVRAIKDAYYMNGLEAAMEKFKAMREHLADYTPGWSDIAGEVMAFLKEKKEEEQMAAGERERQMNRMDSDLSHGQGVTLVVTQNNSPTTNSTTTIDEQHNDNCLQTWGKVENSNFVTPQTDGTA